MDVHDNDNVWTVKHYIYQLAMGFEWKMLLSIAGTIIAFVEGFYSQLIWGFLVLFCLDFISGILKSVKKGTPISSKRLRESVTKLGAYMILITALIIASRYEQSFVPIVTVTYYYFMFTELKSIVENVEELGVNVSPLLKMNVNERISKYSETTTSTSEAIAGTTVTTEVIEQTEFIERVKAEDYEQGKTEEQNTSDREQNTSDREQNTSDREQNTSDRQQNTTDREVNTSDREENRNNNSNT